MNTVFRGYSAVFVAYGVNAFCSAGFRSFLSLLSTLIPTQNFQYAQPISSFSAWRAALVIVF